MSQPTNEEAQAIAAAIIASCEATSAIVMARHLSVARSLALRHVQQPTSQQPTVMQPVKSVAIEVL